ncbi:MAG: hypothetical protein H6708_10780 [Kofleriaceae bacterium]|nr:hypothetical protein [Myxococcales bacterium]MCB9560881.1 hypothetical protein [Kofleriaceae bacterium]
MSRETLTRLQRGLEELYRIVTGVEVTDFVVDEGARDAILRASDVRTAREQLLVAEDGDDVSIALFVDRDALANLARRDPSDRLDDGNLGDFLLALEGVSHFVYAVWCARGDRTVTALELELQAEVDKYVTCVLLAGADRHAAPRWRRRLFEQFAYEPDLDADERDRYRVANENAKRYAASLERRFVADRRVPAMLAELRRFYRLPLGGKLAHIAQAA